MQQQNPPQGRLFPDPPQDQPTAAPRFSSTGTQPYEPQLRMQQTGAYSLYHSARYTTGSLQALHGQPVQTLPPMSTMPTAQAYQAAMQQAQTQPQASPQGTPLMVQTVQGTPVIVTLEALQAALAQQSGKAPQSDRDEEAETPERDRKRPARKQRRKERTLEKSEKERKAKPRRIKLSVLWFVFGIIGMGTTAFYILRLVVTFLLRLKGSL